MFEISQLIAPKTLAEAYASLTASRANCLLGGCAFLKMGDKRINQGIDLNGLGLDTIERQDGWISIGATSTYGDLSRSSLLQAFAGGAIPRALAPIVGIQLRNCVQVGASVFSAYGFSDIIPVLLALGAEVTLYHDGRMPLADFLTRPRSRDILVAVHLPDHRFHAAYQSLRLTTSDLPVVNCAVALDLDTAVWGVAIGSLPSRARLVPDAATILTRQGLTDPAIAEAVAACQRLPFGTNARAGADYRRAMAGVLLERAILEVRAC